MRIVILDERESTRERLAEILNKSNIESVLCYQSGTFMESIEDKKPDKVAIDYGSWKNGRVIYNYFNFNSKLEEIPVVFYNTPENFISINNRKKHEGDQVLPKPSDIDSIAEVILQG